MHILRRTSAILATSALAWGISISDLGNSVGAMSRTQAATVSTSSSSVASSHSTVAQANSNHLNGGFYNRPPTWPWDDPGSDHEGYNSTNYVKVNLGISGQYAPNPHWNVIHFLPKQERNFALQLTPDRPNKTQIINTVQWDKGLKVTGHVTAEQIPGSRRRVTVEGQFTLHERTNVGWLKVATDQFSYVARDTTGCTNRCHLDVTRTIEDRSKATAHNATVDMTIYNHGAPVKRP